MADALFVQQTGVSYSAPEFRRAQAAYIANGGVVYGLSVTAGLTSLTVSAGLAVAQDGQTQPAYYIVPIEAVTTVNIDPQASGSRTDRVFIAVNDSPATLTQNGVTIAIGAGYLGSAVSSPANSTDLGSVVVTPTGITYTDSRVIAEAPTVVNRYLRRDVPDVLAAGTSAATPVNTLDVVNKSYVDLYNLRTPPAYWVWGGAGYVWHIPSGSWNKPPGAAGFVQVQAGHLYRFDSQYTLLLDQIVNGQCDVRASHQVFTDNAGALGALEIVMQEVWTGPGVVQTPAGVVRPDVHETLSSYYFASTSHGAWFATMFAANNTSAAVYQPAFSQAASPMSWLVDLGTQSPPVGVLHQ